jgi:hypothetical protein
MGAPPTVTARVSSDQVAQLEQQQQQQQQQQKHAAASGGAAAANVQAGQTSDQAQLTSAVTNETEDKKLSNK